MSKRILELVYVVFPERHFNDLKTHNFGTLAYILIITKLALRRKKLKSARHNARRFLYSTLFSELKYLFSFSSNQRKRKNFVVFYFLMEINIEVRRSPAPMHFYHIRNEKHEPKRIILDSLHHNEDNSAKIFAK